MRVVAVVRMDTGTRVADVVAPPSAVGATVVIGSLHKRMWISPRGTTLALAWSDNSTRSYRSFSTLRPGQDLR